MCDSQPCPCGSGAPYGACCAPLHRGDRPAADAVALMRSRYSAFITGQVAYLWRTMHPQHEDRAGGEQHVLVGLRRAVRSHRFLGLRILDSCSGTDEAQVLFHARVFVQGVNRSFLELSTFLLEPEGWLYFAGLGRAQAEAPDLDIDGFQRLSP